MNDQARVQKDQVYGEAGGRALHCDVFHPETPNGVAVLMLHGGGWRQGDRGMVTGQAGELTRHGFTCVAAEYRLTPEAAWPAQIEDCKAALRWMRAHAADLNTGTDKIVVLGNSAGAHLALMLAATPNVPRFEGHGGHSGVPTHVAACIAVYAPTHFYVGTERTSGGTAATALLGVDPDPDTARAASPMTYVHPDFPPTFLLHGTADKVVPVSASIRFFEALSKAGGRVDMHVYAEQPHGWARQPNWTGPTMAEAVVFLTRYVVNPSAYALATQE